MEFLFSSLQFLWVVFLVVMVFNLMIIVHEYGHFLAARWRGVVVDRFQIWFGKPIWKKTINGVQYGLGSIPAGGFVSLPQMVTMESIEGEVDDELKKDLPPISPLDKIIVAFAGPLFSFLLAVVFAVGVWAWKRPVTELRGNTVIGFIAEDSPAEKAGLQLRDDIKRIDGQPIKRFFGMTDSVMWAVVASEQEKLEVEVERDGELVTLDVIVPRPEPPKFEGPWYTQLWKRLSTRPPLPQMGAGPAVSPIVAATIPNSPAAKAGLEIGDQILEINGEEMFVVEDILDKKWSEGETVSMKIKRGRNEIIDLEVAPRKPDEPEEFDRALLGIAKWDTEGVRILVRQSPLTQVWDGCRAITQTIKKVFFSPKSGIGASHLSGPFGIMGLYYDLFQHPDGWRLVLWFSVVLNVNLAILNLLPFPVLDGGHIVMSIAEWIRRKPLNPTFLGVVQTGFVLLLFGFMIFITFKDVGDRVGRNGAEPSEQPVVPVFKE